jgi:hypothetical protein
MNKTAEMIGRRLGGGPVQVGTISFADLANVLVSANSGYDSKHSKSWEGKKYALERFLKEYNYPVFNEAIIFAVVRKYAEDAGFLPLALASIDIEAVFKPGSELHREIEISGMPGPVNKVFMAAISKKVGITTENGNRGDSMEFVVFLNTAGIWTHVRDIEKTKNQKPMNRKTGIVIITSSLTLYAESGEGGMLTINNLQPIPNKLLSVKTREAIKNMRAVYEELGMK